MFGHPGDLLVEFNHAVAELGHGHEPGAHGLVDEGLAAAPAVGIGVGVGGLLDQNRTLGPVPACQIPGPVAQIGNHEAVRVKHLLAGIVRHLGGELAAIVYWHNGADAEGAACVHVIFTEGWCDVDKAGAVLSGDEIAGDDGPCVWAGSLTFGAALGRIEVVKDRGVAPPDQLGALEAREHLGFLAKLLRVGRQKRLGQNDTFAREHTLGRADRHVIDIRAHRDGKV